MPDQLSVIGIKNYLITRSYKHKNNPTGIYKKILQ